jgi:hypothetical protein
LTKPLGRCSHAWCILFAARFIWTENVVFTQRFSRATDTVKRHDHDSIEPPSLLSFRICNPASLELEVIAPQLHQPTVLGRQRPRRFRRFPADRLLWCGCGLPGAAAEPQRPGPRQASDRGHLVKLSYPMAAATINTTIEAAKIHLDQAVVFGKPNS